METTFIDPDNFPPAPDPLTKEIWDAQFPYLSSKGLDPLKMIEVGYRAACKFPRLIKVSDKFPPIGAPVYKKEGEDFIFVGRFVEGDTFSFAPNRVADNFSDCYWINY